ncbi:HypC/HybG/HupF family hydrogenase formation chaperone [Synechococcus sp. HJ21-Hayes]|jgi:hydrogenase expression/formation protein HypC|nr:MULTISPECIES: HypC/HybG/HupF family hydrogenase formation chaperone [unclassified Synechococcus]MCP9832090.1 HypC/HybG/HupF family hydrogenase formation chaperone [Synechococcus sp. JJ3a-Johnson]MCP9853469.1 HypC/HybG/HupF family hydrogenase formation chaperone [Synechococcus sp. HJ21-Hayes]
MCLAVPGELVSINEHHDPLWRTGDVSFGGVLRQVSLACVPEAQLGDQLLVHVGMALAVLEP